MRYPSQSVGDTTLVASRVVSINPCKLVGIVGYNNGGADVFMFICETAAVPANGQKGKYSFRALAGLTYSFDLPNPVDLDACTVVASSTAETITIAAGTPVSIQALLAS